MLGIFFFNSILYLFPYLLFSVIYLTDLINLNEICDNSAVDLFIFILTTSPAISIYDHFDLGSEGGNSVWNCLFQASLGPQWTQNWYMLYKLYTKTKRAHPKISTYD